MTDPQQFLIYQSEDGSTRIDVMLEAETPWLDQKRLTELFGKAKGTVSEHTKHIFEEGELNPAATVRLFRTVQSEGGRDVTRELEHYYLDMVLALGFRVRSPVGVRFRQWANDPNSQLKTTLKAEIDQGAWARLNSDTSRASPKPKSGRIAVKVINHLGDEVMKVFRVT